MKLNQMCCNGYLPVLVDHHLFLPSPLPSFLLPASLLVSPHSLIGCGLTSPVPAHLSTMDVKYSVHKLYSSTRPYVPTKLCTQSYPTSPFPFLPHTHTQSPTHLHPHPPSYGYETGRDSHIHFQLTSSQPSSPWWLVSLPHPLSTSLSLWKPYSSIFLPPVKWPSSLQVLLGRSRTGRFISVSHQCFQLGLKVGPLAALCTVAIDTTGDIILLEGGYLGSAL